MRGLHYPTFVTKSLVFYHESHEWSNFTNGYTEITLDFTCLLYTSPSPRDRTRSRMPSSA